MTNPYGQQPYGQQQPTYYQPYGYPQPGYPQPYGMPVGPPPGPKPNNHLAWAIVSIFLFWPTAIVAIIKATNVDSEWNQGRYGEAQASSDSAKTFCLISTIVGVVTIAIALIFFIIALSAISDIPDYDYDY
jgi:Interferon-induced transmembrane protein